MEKYIIYTDGAYRPSTKTGGYACIITQNNQIVAKLYRGYRETTNNRQELIAVLEALRWFKKSTQLIIYSDSQYVVSSINNGYLSKWISENDTSKKNLDLWKLIYKLLKIHNVTFIWVKGHNNNKFNELADLYATHSAECLDLPKDNDWV